MRLGILICHTYEPNPVTGLDRPTFIFKEPGKDHSNSLTE